MHGRLRGCAWGRVVLAVLIGACSSQGEGDRGKGGGKGGTDEGTGTGGAGLSGIGGPTGMTPGQMVWEGEETCPSCMESRAGVGGTPFDPDGHDSENLSVDPDGALVLRLGSGSGTGYIWISNTGEDTVSKINTDTYVEEGRYKLVAPAGIGNVGSDPSRTSVDLSGDAYVASRGGHALTRVSVDGDGCPDTNGDGVITTSHSATEILPFGQDDCVRWQTELMGTVRGVAVQEFPGETMVQQVPDGPPIITETPGHKFVWVGNTESQLWKIDADTGDILIAMTAPAPVYGLAISADGRCPQRDQRTGPLPASVRGLRRGRTASDRVVRPELRRGRAAGLVGRLQRARRQHPGGTRERAVGASGRGARRRRPRSGHSLPSRLDRRRRAATLRRGRGQAIRRGRRRRLAGSLRRWGERRRQPTREGVHAQLQVPQDGRVEPARLVERHGGRPRARGSLALCRAATSVLQALSACAARHARFGGGSRSPRVPSPCQRQGEFMFPTRRR